MNLKLIVVAGIAAIVAMTACGSDGSSSPATDAATPRAAEAAGSIDELGGVEWVLNHLNAEQPVPAGHEVTLVFVDGNFVGGSGCNRYSAGVTAGERPGDLSIGLPLGTRMACPEEAMALEGRYLATLESVGGYSIRDGVLSLTWTREGDSGTMTFESRPLPE